jgi:hypothetical protein
MCIYQPWLCEIGNATVRHTHHFEYYHYHPLWHLMTLDVVPPPIMGLGHSASLRRIHLLRPTSLVLRTYEEGVDYKPGSVSRLSRDGDHFSVDPGCPGPLAAYPG